MVRMIRLVLLGGLLAALVPGVAAAHCDTLDGPVVKAARAALDSRDVTKVLRWVSHDREAEIREAFDRTLRVRQAGGEAATLADTWFFETLVRLHRTGEGAPFDGLKPAGSVDPLVSAIDRTLETSSVDSLTAKVAAHVTEGVRQRYAKAVEAQRHAGESVEAGRAFVAAYVEYLHYVEALHKAANGEASAHAEHTPPAGPRLIP